MKYFNKLAPFFLMLLIGYGIDTLSYTYTITNKTGRKLKVQLYYDRFNKLNESPALIKVGEKHVFSFTRKLCLDHIKVARKKGATRVGLSKVVIWDKFKLVRIKDGLLFYQDKYFLGDTCKNRNFTLLWGKGDEAPPKFSPRPIPFTGVYIQK